MTEASVMRPVRSAATLISVYVRPEHRRARAGGRMVGEFLAWAKGRGAGHVEETAYTANPDAVRFYERHGFAASSVTLRRSL
ncbi:GNAT family N-acetyltransferase [Streptomyces sp. NPDC048751]|uniref:GNAT family N-acetyltransferase n=1 Tax=Streptomyces sp. NPDC048751 TaxID=3365591 RepID=UPI003712C466